MLCPRCNTPLERDGAVAYCATCRGSIHSHKHVSNALELAVDDSRNEPSFLRPRQPVAACPSCKTGTLLSARVWNEGVAQCENCHAWWLEVGMLATLRAHVARERAVVTPSFEAKPELDPVGYAAGDTFEYDTALVNRLAVPLALAVGILAQLLGFGILVYATLQMWTHELGHAMASWLAGVFAMPLPFFTVMGSGKRSFGVVLFTWGLIAAIIVYAHLRKSLTLRTIGLLLLLAAAWLTSVLTEHEAEQWFLFGGLAGEIVLSTLLIVAFYEKLPARWDFWRYPALFGGAIAFVHTTWTWVSVTLGHGGMPHGSAVGSASDGDVERLRAAYGWSEAGLAHAYLAIAVVAGAVIFSAYASGVARAERLVRSEQRTVGLPLKHSHEAARRPLLP